MKTKTTMLLFTLLLSIRLFSQAPTFQWAKSIGGAYYDQAKSTSIDLSGNIYTTGYFRGTVDFDPGPSVYNLTSPANNISHFFVSKLDSAGNFIWAKAFGDSTFFSHSEIIKTDDIGNIYVAGEFYGTVDFDPGPGIFTLTAPIAFISKNAFLLKLDSSGNFIYAKSFSGNNSSIIVSINIDLNKNLYLTGEFDGSVDFNPGPGSFNMYGSKNNFVCKLDSTGNFVWAKSFGSTATQPDYILSSGVDFLGNVYIYGTLHGTIDFDPGAGVYNLSSIGTSGFDLFILKLDTNGSFIWCKSFEGNISNINYIGTSSLVLDSAANVYVTGYYSGTVDFDPGSGVSNFTASADDIFISKIDSSGNLIWAKSFGGGSYDHGVALALDNYNNLYVTGHCFSNIDFDPGPGVYYSTNSGFVFISKFDSIGNFITVKTFAYWGVPTSIFVDKNKNIYTVGSYSGVSNFHTEASGVYNLPFMGDQDIFIHKMSQTQITNVGEEQNSSDFSVYPNPTVGNISINLKKQTEAITVKIKNILGQEVFSKQYSSTNLISLDIEGDKGIYFIELQNAEGKKSVMKVVKN